MIYRVKEKFCSFGDQFTITDPYETPMFQVHGKAFSWGNKLSFMNMQGDELAFIEGRGVKRGTAGLTPEFPLAERGVHRPVSADG